MPECCVLFFNRHRMVSEIAYHNYGSLFSIARKPLCCEPFLCFNRKNGYIWVTYTIIPNDGGCGSISVSVVSCDNGGMSRTCIHCHRWSIQTMYFGEIHETSWQSLMVHLRRRMQLLHSQCPGCFQMNRLAIVSSFRSPLNDGAILLIGGARGFLSELLAHNLNQMHMSLLSN